MLDFINTNDIELKEYNSKTRNAMQEMKSFCDGDDFIIDCRKKAHLKVNRAIVNGKIHWNRLPKLINSNTKMKKDIDGIDLEIFGLSLAPHFISGFNTCNGLSLGCAKSCLMFTGHGSKFMVDCNGDHNVAIARIIRTILWFKHREEFKTRLLHELKLKYNNLKSKGIQLAFRPNVFSEIKFEIHFSELFNFCKDNDIPIYDYVKDIKRIVNNPFKEFYSMTFSLSENNALFIPTALKHNCNIAIVLDIPLTKKKENRKKYLVDVPKHITINGIKLETIDGDINDARFFDSKNKAVVLRGKGNDIKNDTTNFMIRINK